MDRLGRHFVEESLDVRAPASLGPRCRQAMHQVVHADRVWSRCVDRRQYRLDLALGEACPLVGFLEFSPNQLDILCGRNGHLDLDACDTSLRLL